ncbi:MAG: PrsW family glutamic-type intramembrane protease [Acidobacteriota bacterium]
MTGVIKLSIVLVPVILFLIALLLLDSFKLVKPKFIILALFIGGFSAGLSYYINNWLLSVGGIKMLNLQRFAAPFIEECIKAIYLIFLINRNKVGFVVDSVLLAFSIGAGFSVIENLYYFYLIPESNLFIWLIRGLGTAILHGGATSIMAIISKNFCERKNSVNIILFLPGLVTAIAIHSVFNLFILPPVISTLIILIIFPILIIISFEQSERSLQKWLGIGFDSDVQILEMIRSGKVLESKIGKHLYSLKNKIQGEILADILCYLRIFIELSIKAKGILIMQESGFTVKTDQETKDKFKEFNFLEKSIGKTGKLVVGRFLHTSSRELWQIHMIQGLGVKKF